MSFPNDNLCLSFHLLQAMIEDSFEMTSHPLPPYYKILGEGTQEGHFVVAGDMRRFTQADFGKANSRHETRSLTKEEFVKTAVCCLLGHKPDVDAYAGKDGKILMVRVTPEVKKMLGVSGAAESPSKKSS